MRALDTIPADTERGLWKAEASDVDLDNDGGSFEHQGFVTRFRRQRSGVAAGLALVGIVVVAVFSTWIAPQSPDDQDLRAVLLGPGQDGHWLGTDTYGRDILSRLIVASRTSLLAAAEGVGVAVLLGVPLGLAAGYVAGRVDRLVMLFTDAAMSFPPIILGVSIVAALGPGLSTAMLAVGIVFSPRFIRLVRASVMSVKEETYIDAARTIGVPTLRILKRHVLPNIVGPLIIEVTVAAGTMMLVESSVSFLGLGVQPPAASWGSMLEEGYNTMSTSPWLVIFPGAAIVIVVFALNSLGNALRASIGRRTYTP